MVRRDDATGVWGDSKKVSGGSVINKLCITYLRLMGLDMLIVKLKVYICGGNYNSNEKIMYISRLLIRNFRAFEFIELCFNEGLNVIIGENNSGKSAIIDALRICLGHGKSENMIFIQESDLHLDPNDPSHKSNEIQFDLIFEFGKEPIEKECFYDFISQDPETNRQTAQLHLKYKLEKTAKRKFFKRSVWGGDNEGQQIPYEALQEIFFTYLSPLRDAISSLKPYSYDNKTSQLFNQLSTYTDPDEGRVVRLNEEKKDKLASELYNIFTHEKSHWKSILDEGNGMVNKHLIGTGINNKHPHVKMNYVGRKYSDVVKGIELKRPIYLLEKLNGYDQKYFDLHQNGLGENNLIYASVVLGDLINRCEDNDLEIYNALLVEEPEAHLHPQYQNTFFEYLNHLVTKGLQIFVTSHSPTITAKSDLRKITVLQKQDSKIAPFSFSLFEEPDFSSGNFKHLRKFLDTTKSQMLFANGVVLIEGIVEAILIPLLSQKFMKTPVDLEKEGIELVNLSGVAFEHFGKLYNNDIENKRLLSKCSIITDSDPIKAKPADGDKPAVEEKPKSDRAIKAEKLKGNNLDVSLAPHTLEYDLFNESEQNKLIMREVYRAMHPGTPDLDGDFDGEILMTKLKSNKDKADFALNLYDRLSEETVVNFNVPDYIQKAIGFVCPQKKENAK